jgi:hypothetical protein
VALFKDVDVNNRFWNDACSILKTEVVSAFMKTKLVAFENKSNRLQILIGMAGLLSGLLVYLVDRSPDQTYFLYSVPINISLNKTLPTLFGSLGNNLPSFIHTFSFILLTVGLMAFQKNGIIIISLSWFFVDCVFEIGQKMKTLCSMIIPDWFAKIPFLENTENYFLQGTFDYSDLAAIAMGAVVAWIVSINTMHKGDHHENKKR